MIYRIRHINDETLIKRECAYILAAWILFSGVSLTCFYIQQSIECKDAAPNSTFPATFNYVTQGTYWTTILRDVVTVAIIVWFTRQVMANNVTLQTKVNEEDINAFMDFDMMLVSVLPHKYFINFLQEDKMSHLPYLQLIHLYKLYNDDSEQY